VAEIRPFKGIHYNEALIRDLTDVICPPYDIISPQQREDLYEKSQYNYIRIEFERELPQDTSTVNRYTRSAETLKTWLSEGILKQDDKPALYLHDHYFTRRDREYRRRNLFARVRLEEWDKMIVRPHEGTLSDAKSDRLSLLFAMNANTSPVLSMYQDNGRQITSLLDEESKRQPLFRTAGNNGERHDFWVIDNPDVIRKIEAALENRPIYIADGHHRYESALNYRNEQRKNAGESTGEEPYNFVMMSLVEFSDPGLLILAPHRLVRGIPKATLSGFASKLKSFFSVEALPLKSPDVWARVGDLLVYTQKMRMVIFGIDLDNLYVVTLDDPAAVSTMMPYFHSELYKKLDVSVVDHVILENLLELSREKEKNNLDYSYEMADAVQRVLRQEFQLAILLSPVKPEMIKEISDNRDKMPRKSTYFYPKCPSGMIINRLDAD